MAAAEGHAPNEIVQKVVLIHAEDERDIDHHVRPFANSIADYCKLPSPADFVTHFKSDNDVGKTVVEQMKTAKNSTMDKKAPKIHAAILLSKKFLKTIGKNEDFRKTVEDLLIEDKRGNVFALIWMDATENDIKTFSAQLFKRWQERVDFPIVQAVLYREYKADYATLAESVYKVWNGPGTFVERPNQPFSYREAHVQENTGAVSPRKEPVESLDPTAMTGYSSSPTVCAGGNEGLFMLQDKMSSNEHDNIPVGDPQADNQSRVTEGPAHDSSPKLVVDAGDQGQGEFKREDMRSSDSNSEDNNLAVGGDRVLATESGEGNSEKVIDTEPSAHVDPDVGPDKECSLPVQSDGCNNTQSAQQNGGNAPTNQDNEVEATQEENKNPESPSDSTDRGDVETKVFKTHDDNKSETQSQSSKCPNPGCNSEDQVVPADKFFTSKEPLVKDFTQDQRDDLMMLMDPPAACVKDWRHLASRKNVPNKKITYWEKKTPSGTLAYLDYLGTHHPKYTVKEFKKDLKGISRMDVLDLLKDFKSQS